MKHIYSVAALPVLVIGAVVFGASDASAGDIEPDTRQQEPVVLVPSPPAVTEVAVDDTADETLQTGAGALGGAGLAVGGIWLFRRRSAPAH